MVPLAPELLPLAVQGLGALLPMVPLPNGDVGDATPVVPLGGRRVEPASLLLEVERLVAPLVLEEGHPGEERFEHLFEAVAPVVLRRRRSDGGPSLRRCERGLEGRDPAAGWRGLRTHDELVGGAVLVRPEQRHELGRQAGEVRPELRLVGLDPDQLQVRDHEPGVLEAAKNALPGEEAEVPVIEQPDRPVGEAPLEQLGEDGDVPDVRDGGDHETAWGEDWPEGAQDQGGLPQMLQDVRADQDVEPLLSQLTPKVERLEVARDHAAADPSGFGGRLGIPLDPGHRAAEVLGEHPRHVPRRAAQFQHALALADQANDARVGVVLTQVDPSVVPVHSASSGVTRDLEGEPGLGVDGLALGGPSTSTTKALSTQSDVGA